METHYLPEQRHKPNNENLAYKHRHMYPRVACLTNNFEA